MINVTSTAGLTGLRLLLTRDNGAVVYLNGTEKWRSNMPAAPTSITYGTAASATVAAPNETALFQQDVSTAGLVVGTNVIAVEVHQRDTTSTDLGFDLDVFPLGGSSNNPPTITDIADRHVPVSTGTGAVSFTVGDAETAAASLTGTSSNTTLVPNANIVFGGSGANRTVTVTPAAGQSGTAIITVSVSDGTNTTSDTFLLSVGFSSIIAQGGTWDYLAPLIAAGAPAAAWNTAGFTPTGWSSGPACIGYGGNGEVTAIPTGAGKPFTVYFRITFVITNTASIAALRLNLRLSSHGPSAGSSRWP